MGTDGFEFVEYIGPDPQALARLFERIWFAGPPSLLSSVTGLLLSSSVRMRNFMVAHLLG